MSLEVLEREDGSATGVTQEAWLSQGSSSPSGIESISSVAGGETPEYRRWKETGFYGFTPELFERMRDEVEPEMRRKYGDDFRICLRGFEEGDHLQAIELARRYGFQLEYMMYSPHQDSEGRFRTGRVILFARNGEQRPMIQPGETVSGFVEPTFGQLGEYRVRPSEVSLHAIGSIVRTADAVSTLNNDQLEQLAHRWNTIFSPNYTLETVQVLLQDQSIPKVILLDPEGNICGAAIAELDPYGNFELTEVFSDMPGIGRLLVQETRREIQRLFPRNRIFMEANMSSAMWKVALACGFTIPPERVSGTPNGHIQSNVLINRAQDSRCRNFATLLYPANYATYAPTR